MPKMDATGSSGEEASKHVQQRILGLLKKNKGSGTTLDPAALNLVTTPEYNNLRANIINHLKKQTVVDDAEGKAGRNPEESLGTGKRSQIRFRPIIMKPVRNSLRKSSVKRVEGMMNNGVMHKLGSATVSGRHGKGDKIQSEGSPLEEGLSKALRGKYRKNPSALRNRSRVERNMKSSNVMSGLMSRSKRNRTDKKQREKRTKLDVSPF